MENSLYILSFCIISIVICLACIILGRVLAKTQVKKAGAIGTLAMLFISMIPVVDLAKQDWRIPECRDESGNIIDNDDKCIFP